MSNSLSDQLLKAGLITQEQVEKADQDKLQQKEKARAKFKKKAGSHTLPAKNKQSRPKQNVPKPVKKQTKEASDLEKFYQQRNQVERQEREAEEKRKREAAERRRKTRKQIRELIIANTKNEAEASIRFNFVVGETVKYLFVTEAQQKMISDGALSITFLDGKRSLIPTDIGQQILELDPEKVVIRFEAGDDTEVDMMTIPAETDVPATDIAEPSGL